MLFGLLLPTLACGLANTIKPLSEYQFSWTADLVTSKLSVEVKVAPIVGKTVGWVGFGIAGGGGGMLGGDMFTAYATGTTTCAIQDRQADNSGKMLPKEDKLSSDGFADWNLDSCSSSGGTLTIGASRLFVTNDAHDLDFVSGPMKLLFAWGQEVPSSSASIGFHDGGYVPLEVSLWGPAVAVFDKSALESDHDMLAIIVPGLPIAAADTYMCVGVNVTQKDGKATQAIVFEPRVEKVNEPYVHHMVLYACQVPVDSTPFSCWSMPPSCQSILWAWGKGGGPLVLPSVTGIEVGSPGRVYAALQMHYSNSGGVKDLVDHSGVNIYRTNQIRATFSGLYLVGTVSLSLPPAHNKYTVSASCLNTSEIPAAGLTVYASAQHAHQRGRRIWTNIIRNGIVVGTLGNNQNYDFNMQQFVTFNPSVTMLPGDVYVTYCSYDTSQDNVTVGYGETTGHEMCFNFLAYYPIINNKRALQTCGLQTRLSPGPSSCTLLPNQPPAAYLVDGWKVSDTNFLAGGNVTCAPGFIGEAQLGCAGYGAPFTFSGCMRTSQPPSGSPSGAPTQVSNAGSLAPTVSVVVVAAAVMLQELLA